MLLLAGVLNFGICSLGKGILDVGVFGACFRDTVGWILAGKLLTGMRACCTIVVVVVVVVEVVIGLPTGISLGIGIGILLA